ncbi:unnamed protein product [Pleuronectes platessa]|uniref:Uncharacterized protein n=1 Tax=Pleuronectes platessa TaxID=8262 RepID=A0A9N7U248_PLEPL|nr:unnamed protein product [Pleuronectes platessa]
MCPLQHLHAIHKTRTSRRGCMRDSSAQQQHITPNPQVQKASSAAHTPPQHQQLSPGLDTTARVRLDSGPYLARGPGLAAKEAGSVRLYGPFCSGTDGESERVLSLDSCGAPCSWLRLVTLVPMDQRSAGYWHQCADAGNYRRVEPQPTHGSRGDSSVPSVLVIKQTCRRGDPRQDGFF